MPVDRSAIGRIVGITCQYLGSSPGGFVSVTEGEAPAPTLPLDATDATFWENWPDGGSTYEYVGGQWQLTAVSTGAVTTTMGLVAVGTWADGFRPPNIRIRHNSGPDAQQFGFLTYDLYVFDAAGGTLAQNTSGTWPAYETNVTDELPLAFASDDVARVSFETFVYTVGPVIELIEFYEP